MAGHNKWKQIKEKKGVADKKRSQLFSKYAKLIRVEAKLARGDMNAPSLRAVIENAKAANMPKENIERAVASATAAGADEKATYEAYGPGGCGLIIECLTDNTNRTVAEIKHLLSTHNIALSTPGSVTWAFSKDENGAWKPQTTIPLNDADGEKLADLVNELEEHDDVQEVVTNAE